MIRRAKISEIPDIFTITQACAKKMQENGIFQWNEHYPSKEAFQKDIDRGELSVMDEEYKPIQWLTPNGNSVYIHRLSVHPNLQGKGLAQQMMDFAENHAREHGFVSVRLDTFSQNKRNQRFYEQRGYQKLGDIYFPKQSMHPFHCYELVL